MRFFVIACVAAVCAAGAAHGQTNATGQAVAVPTPTPPPVGTASTSLNSSLTGGGVVNGQPTMGTGVNVPASSAASPIVPGAITISGNASSVGSGNVAGSVQINSGGPGSISSPPTPVSPIPTYVTPGTGIGTPAGTSVTAPNPNPGSVQ